MSVYPRPQGSASTDTGTGTGTGGHARDASGTAGVLADPNYLGTYTDPAAFNADHAGVDAGEYWYRDQGAPHNNYFFLEHADGSTFGAQYDQDASPDPLFPAGRQWLGATSSGSGGRADNGRFADSDAAIAHIDETVAAPVDGTVFVYFDEAEGAVWTITDFEASVAGDDSKADVDLGNVDIPAAHRRNRRARLGFAELSPAQRVTASSQVITELSPHDVREISHNQAVRTLPANGTEVETDRLYFGDDAAWDEEIYVCIQDRILTTDDRPELGADWQTYFEKQTTRFAQVAALPAPSAVTARDLGKVHLVRASHDGPVTMQAHIAPVEDAKLGELTTADDGMGRIGFADNRGHITGYAGITRLDEILHTGGQHQLVLHVAADAQIPRENTPKLVYIREQGSSADWWEITVVDGADGAYESQGYSGVRTLAAGARYDVYIRPIAQSSAIRIQTSQPAEANRYDFFPMARKWSITAERDDIDQNTVIIRELVNDPMIPAAPAGTGSARRILIGESGAYSLVNEIPEFMIPAAIARDSEITRALILGLLDLTESERAGILVGVSIANGVLSFAQNDGSPATITLPAGAADGVVIGVAFNAPPTVMTLTIDTGGVESTIDVPIPAGLRGAEAGAVISSAPVAFYATLTDKADIQADLFTDAAAALEIMEIADGDIGINVGGFTVETANNISEVVIGLDGLYTVGVNFTFGSAASRTTPRARIKRTRGADVVVGAIATGGYLRGQGTYSGDIAALHFSQPVNLLAGDKITIQAINTSNDQLNLSGADSSIYLRKEEGALAANDGFVVEVGPGGPPTATATSIRHVYKNSQRAPPQFWIGYQAHFSTTPASADSTLIAAGAAGYRGARYGAPAVSANGDWFWERGTNGGWEFRSGGQYFHVGFAELKTQAMNAAGDALFFGADDVFLNQVISVAQAAAVIQNQGGVVAGRKYWAIVAGSQFREITNFIAAVNPEDFYKFVELQELVGPSNEQVDSALTAPSDADIWLETSIDVSAGRWGFLRPVGITDEDIRFDLELLRGKTAAQSGGVGAPAEQMRIAFGTNELFLGVTAAENLLIASGAPVTFWPTEIRVRRN